MSLVEELNKIDLKTINSIYIGVKVGQDMIATGYRIFARAISKTITLDEIKKEASDLALRIDLVSKELDDSIARREAAERSETE